MATSFSGRCRNFGTSAVITDESLYLEGWRGAGTLQSSQSKWLGRGFFGRLRSDYYMQYQGFLRE